MSRGRLAKRPRQQLGALACALLSVGHLACSVPLAGGLDDLESNRVVSALERSGLEAAKDPDPSVEGRWRVSVSREDVPRAMSVMREEELPRTPPPGVLEA
ncbi:MAG: hypothetical protein M3O36_09970, partial [Myxococcota bacterium]|nr:hypothetical protein [Myxococcota bacterium]